MRIAATLILPVICLLAELPKTWVSTAHAAAEAASPKIVPQPVTELQTRVLTGRVVDEQGDPVAGAKVQVAYSEIATETDGSGRFRLAGLNVAEDYVLIFTAIGKAPCRREVTRQRSTGTLEVTLRPGRTIRFRVVDQQDNAVEDALIGCQSWKGVFASALDTLRTDAKGLAAWNEAPADEIEYSVSKDGYARAELRAAPAETEHVVTLHPLLRISGTVTSATSGEPIEAFQVVPVTFLSANSPFIPRSLAKSAKAGRFSVEFARPNVGHSVQIEAPGFLTVRSKSHRIGEPNPVLDFRLEPVARAVGRVVDDTGTPVGDARVYVTTASQPFSFRETEAEHRRGSDNYEVGTKEDGSFEIVPQFEDYCLVAMSSRGYAKLNRPAQEAPGRIELQRWARVEGRLLQDDKPVPSWPVNLKPIRPFAEGQPLIADRLRAVTDKAGRFVFERVPPGPYRVMADLNIWEDSPLTSSSSIPLDPAPGQDIAVVLGGEGAKLVGRVRLSQSAQTDIDYHFSLNYLLAIRPGIQPPPAVASHGFDWRRGWMDAWKSSAEGEVYLATLYHYFVKLAPNGSFRVGGLSPGEYELSLKVYQPPSDGCLVYPLGTAVVRFRIEEGSHTVDLGEILLEAMQAPKIGEQAPLFQFKELDGTVVNIGQFRGRHVLLDFWATWCAPCVRSLAEVEQIRNRYGKEGHLAVIALNLDADQEKARAFVKRRNLPWHHAFPGDWAQTDLPKRFAVSALPSYALIGPDGKLLAQSHKLEEIVPILESATRERGPQPKLEPNPASEKRAIGPKQKETEPTLASIREASAETNVVRVYTVNRKVAEFPDQEDMSTPEAAYATVNRLMATGDQAFWRRLSAPRVAQGMEEQSGKREVPADEKAKFLGAEILEVHLWETTNAVVIAQMPQDCDLRWLCCVDGQWLNDGNDGAPDLEKARDRVTHGRAYREAERLRNSRPPVADPDTYLRPFVEFLEREAADPQEFLLKVLAKHRVVILGEVHNRQRYWAFNTALVRTPKFAQQVGVIYLELPSNDQPLVDQFLAAPKYDPAPVIDVLRDMHEFGWPDQPTLEFCQAVWEVNQSLPVAQRLRIVLADMARPWKEIHQRADWAKYDVDRDELMATLIARDLRDHAQDPRHALFIVGCMHAPKNLTYPGGEPFKSAGWHLCQRLGATNVFALFPHSPVMSDHHDPDGRLALGLFETAFAVRSNRPMAFPLDHGPFGDLLFDHSLDFTTTDPYRAGFDAFLYLGPLEDEIVSPLVPGFYTDEYAREIDRRCRLTDGQGLESIPGIGEVSGEAIRRLREAWWGRPRYEWRRLGPLDAWHDGSGWKQRSRDAAYREIRKDPTVIRHEAELLFNALRQADYSKAHNWHTFPSPNVGLYWVRSDRDVWTQWVCQHFRTNPMVQMELGNVTLQPNGRPEVPYELLLKDRTHLEGVLPFEWRPEVERWEGFEGLDWHLRKDPP